MYLTVFFVSTCLVKFSLCAGYVSCRADNMIIAVGVENQPSVELCVTAIKIVFVFVLCVEMWCNISHQLHKYQQRYYCAVTWWLREQRKILQCDYYLWSMLSFTFYNSISALRSFTGEISIRLERFKLSEWSIVPLLLFKTTSILPYNQIIAFTGKALMTVRLTVHYIYWTYIIYYTRIRHLSNDVLRIWIDNIRTRFHNIPIVQKVIYKLIAQYKVLVLDLLVC